MRWSSGGRLIRVVVVAIGSEEKEEAFLELVRCLSAIDVTELEVSYCLGFKKREKLEF
jgi:hypothetical protein